MEWVGGAGEEKWKGLKNAPLYSTEILEIKWFFLQSLNIKK